jgi:hypothetical protein
MRVTLTAAEHEAGKVEVGPEVSAVCISTWIGVRKNAILGQFGSGRLFGDNDLIFVCLRSTPHNLVPPLRERMNSMHGHRATLSRSQLFKFVKIIYA